MKRRHRKNDPPPETARRLYEAAALLNLEADLIKPLPNREIVRHIAEAAEAYATATFLTLTDHPSAETQFALGLDHIAEAFALFNFLSPAARTDPLLSYIDTSWFAAHAKTLAHR